MGSCIFTIYSIYLIPQDSVTFIATSRITAGIVRGIAFISAGSIIARKCDVKGLTTAASIWVIAGLGLMVGLGNYLFLIISIIIVFIVLRQGLIAEKTWKWFFSILSLLNIWFFYYIFIKKIREELYNNIEIDFLF